MPSRDLSHDNLYFINYYKNQLITIVIGTSLTEIKQILEMI